MLKNTQNKHYVKNQGAVVSKISKWISCGCFWTFVQLELAVCKTGVVKPFPITNSVPLPSSYGTGRFSQWCRFAKMVGIQPRNKHTARAANGRGGRSVPAQHCCPWRGACPGNTEGCWKLHHPRAGQQFILGNADFEPHAKQLPVSTAGLHGFCLNQWGEGKGKIIKKKKRDGCSLIDTGWVFPAMEMWHQGIKTKTKPHKILNKHMLNIKARGFVVPEQQCTADMGMETASPAAQGHWFSIVQVASSLPAPVPNSSVSKERGRLPVRLQIASTRHCLLHWWYFLRVGTYIWCPADWEYLWSELLP